VHRMCAIGSGGGVCACRVLIRKCIKLLILHWVVWALCQIILIMRPSILACRVAAVAYVHVGC
jgi:hypothetical protein